MPSDSDSAVNVDDASQLIDKLTDGKASKKKYDYAEYSERLYLKKKFGNVLFGNVLVEKKCVQKCSDNNIRPKTAAEKSKQYRERQKAKKIIQSQGENVNCLQSKSTKAYTEYMREYMKKYRQNKKLQNQRTQLNALPDTDYLNAKKKKTSDVHHLPESEQPGSQIEFQASQLIHHNREQAASTKPLLQEFKRLSLNTLKTKAQTIVDFMNLKKGITVFTLNVQSLRKHSIDLNDSVICKSNILLLSDTWLNNDEEGDIPNFNCITQFKRDSVRSGGVAVHRNNNDRVNIVTPHMDVILTNIRNLNVRTSNVAHICAVECVLDNGKLLIMAVIYVSPNQKIIHIQEFIHRALLEYSKTVSETLSQYGSNLYKLPLILAGDFNINFSSKNSEPLLKFLLDEFNLQINSDPTQSTTRYNTTIDAVFSRYLETVESQTYVSYFSYHKPIITAIECTDEQCIDEACNELDLMNDGQ